MRFMIIVTSCEAFETAERPDPARASIEVHPFHDRDAFVSSRKLDLRSSAGTPDSTGRVQP